MRRCLTFAVTTLIVGCSGTGVPSHPVAAASSWMMPDAKKQPSLLYVSNFGSSDVTVYTYLDGNGLILVGQLTGFVQPAGMCTDKAGDVWITDYGYGVKKAYEYAHGGTSPINYLRQGGRAYDCAVDMTTGDLAVAVELPNGKLTFGMVNVFAPGAREATHYDPPYGFSRVDFLAYDDKSNLYVDGIELYSTSNLFEIQKGGKELVEMALQGATLEEPGAIQWVNPTLLIGDENFKNQGVAGAYKVLVSKSTATVVGTLTFVKTQSAGAFWRRAGRIVVPDSAGNIARIYNLADGSRYSSLTTGLSQPFGAAVSQAP
jgi:hypothetical protein